MGETPADFLVLDSTVVSNFAYTDSLDIVCEGFPDVRVTNPVIDEVERGADDGHEFLRNALRYFPKADQYSSAESARIPRTDSIKRRHFRSRSLDEMESTMSMIGQEFVTTYDRTEASKLVRNCMNEIECGEASAIVAGYLTENTVATDDKDARNLARRYSIGVTDSLGVLARCVTEDCIDAETANEWLNVWIRENEYYSPVDDIRELDGV